MDDNALFETTITQTVTGGVPKQKYLLRKQFQSEVLAQAKKVAHVVATHKHVERVLLMGSVVTQELGKYKEQTGRSAYSDIDVFVLTNAPMQELDLSDMGLVKKRYESDNGSYYRISVSDGQGKPLRILERFSVDLWFITPSTYAKTMRQFPHLLDGAIAVK